MGEGVYRDGLAGVRMRAEELAREVAEREARLTRNGTARREMLR